MHSIELTSPLRILVIDDDEIARASMVDLLKSVGHEVYSLPTPIGATKRIIDANVDVVVLDLMMPSMRGDKLAALLGKNPRLRNLGVVLVTGLPAEEITKMAGQVNAAAIVEKTAAHQELARAVRRAAGRGTAA